MRLAIVLAVVLVASVAFAAPTAIGPASNGTGVFEYEPTRDIKWEQLPLVGGTAPAAQYAYDYPFYAECADDFECIDGTPITAVEWWGSYWNPGYVVSPDYFTIRFYDNVPAPPFSQPGDLVYEELCYDYTEEYDAYYDQYHYFCDLAVPFDQMAGMIYWVSVQPALPFLTGSQWGWCECDPIYYWMDEGVGEFDVLGIPRWTPFSDPIYIGAYIELAFVLHGPASPVENTSWGGIKAMFK
jgi:hypothetical protein